MGNLTTTHFSEWRDARSRHVQAGTVLREISYLSAVLECARIEWQWIASNPIRDIRKPRMPDHREVTISPAQVRKILRAMGYSPSKPVRTVAQAVATCFLTALRTGMRAGELTGLTWARVEADHAVLPVTKTFPRKVPLSRKALRLIEKMRGYDPETVFGMTPQSLDANFRKYRDRAGLGGFTFHDSRHTAATMLSRKLDVMDLCRMFGWTDTRMALRYYNPSASSISQILNTIRK
jgi:integrase